MQRFLKCEHSFNRIGRILLFSNWTYLMGWILEHRFLSHYSRDYVIVNEECNRRCGQRILPSSSSRSNRGGIDLVGSIAMCQTTLARCFRDGGADRQLILPSVVHLACHWCEFTQSIREMFSILVSSGIDLLMLMETERKLHAAAHQTIGIRY